MKKYLWFLGALVFIIAAFGVFSIRPETKVLGTNSVESPAPTPEYKNQVTFDFNGKRITGVWYKVADPFNLYLVANFNDKKSAVDVFEAKNCRFLSDAGFYMKDSTPTGLFISEGTQIKGFYENKLFDGVLSVNYLGTPRITRVVPGDNLRIAVQTGPILKENIDYQNLIISEDKEARRVIAGVTGTNELYFVVFYEKISAYLGPNLSDMPEVLRMFERNSGITFADAINLDGGSASAFYTEGFSLSELSPVGAFFCEK